MAQFAIRGFYIGELRLIMNSQVKDAHKVRFKAAYENSTAWWTGKPQPVLVDHISREPLKSPFLDIGCGTGDLSVWLASKGYEVLGIDYVPKAIELARKKAKVSNSTAIFAVQDFFHWRNQTIIERNLIPLWTQDFFMQLALRTEAWLSRFCTRC